MMMFPYILCLLPLVTLNQHDQKKNLQYWTVIFFADYNFIEN